MQPVLHDDRWPGKPLQLATQEAHPPWPSTRVRIPARSSCPSADQRELAPEAATGHVTGQHVLSKVILHASPPEWDGNGQLPAEQGSSQCCEERMTVAWV